VKTLPRNSHVLRTSLACAAVIASFALFTSSAVAASTIGKVKMTGQVSGSLTIPKMLTDKFGGALVGCQIQENTTSQVLIYLADGKVQLNGKSVAEKAGTLTVSVNRDGASESVGPVNGNAQVSLTLVIGAKTYLWASASGTISIKSRGGAGTFSVGEVPAGTLSGNPVQSGAATKPVKLSGSWSYCRPFPT
jgi:hypothetical protein